MTNPLPRSSSPDLGRPYPQGVTTEALIVRAHGHREEEEYPTAEQLLGNLPAVLRALCDHVLTGQATALDVAYRIASIIEVYSGPRILDS